MLTAYGLRFGGGLLLCVVAAGPAACGLAVAKIAPSDPDPSRP